MKEIVISRVHVERMMEFLSGYTWGEAQKVPTMTHDEVVVLMNIANKFMSNDDVSRFTSEVAYAIAFARNRDLLGRFGVIQDMGDPTVLEAYRAWKNVYYNSVYCSLGIFISYLDNRVPHPEVFYLDPIQRDSAA